MSASPCFRLRVFFDGASPLCFREINHYRRQDRQRRLEPIDSLCAPPGRSFESVMVSALLGISLRGHRLRRVRSDQPGDPAPLARQNGLGGYLLGRSSVRDSDAGR